LSWVQISSAADIALPWTFPQACTDFGFDWTITGSAATFFATGDGLLTIPLGPTEGNALILERDSGGNVAFTINTATGVTSVSRTVTSVLCAGTDRPLQVALLGQHLIVKFNAATVFNGEIDRNRAEFTPVIGFGSGTPTIGLTTAYVGEAQTVMPWLTDLDLWGTNGGTRGGNDENHLAEPGRIAIFGGVLAATRFA
jgi:hypothetical protein